MPNPALDGPYQYPPDGGMDVYGHPTNPYGRCEYMNRNNGNGPEPPDSVTQTTFLVNLAATNPAMFQATLNQWGVSTLATVALTVAALIAAMGL